MELFSLVYKDIPCYNLLIKFRDSIGYLTSRGTKSPDSYHARTPVYLDIYLKISHLPLKLRFSAKYSFFGRHLSHGHYQTTYQPLEGAYWLNKPEKIGQSKGAV